MKKLFLTLLVISGCGVQLPPVTINVAPPPDGKGPAQVVDTPIVAAPIDPVVPDPGTSASVSSPVSVTLSVFSNSKTVAPINGWGGKTYTAIGYCTVYLSDTYCWDDGMKTLQWTANSFTYGPYTYSYFNVNLRANGTLGSSNGGMYSDAITVPTIVNVHLTNLINAGDSAVADVLAGTSGNVDCTKESNGNLTCPGFVVDVNQVGL